MNKSISMVPTPFVPAQETSTPDQTSQNRKVGQERSPEIRRADRSSSGQDKADVRRSRAPESVASLRATSLPRSLDAGQAIVPGQGRRKRAVQPLETAVQDIFSKVRTAYSNGLKSGNKTYSLGINVDNNIANKGRVDTDRQVAANKTVSVIRGLAADGLLSETKPALQGELVIDAANCGELAGSAAKLAVEQGMHAEVWEYKNADHVFAVIGTPPPGDTVDFSHWKDVWIVDPWMNIASKAPDYIQQVNDKMEKWHAYGKVILTAQGEQLAIDSKWLDAINNGEKSSLQAPSADDPNPWKDLSTAVDRRKLLQEQDMLLPPLKFGERMVRRTDLFDMGVVLDGKSIDADGINIPDQQGLADRLTFDEDVLRQKIQEYGAMGDHQSVDRVVETIVEINAQRRSPASAPLLVSSAGEVGAVSKVLNAQLEDLRTLASEAGRAARKGNPATFALPGKAAMAVNNIGVGLQAFGAYNGIRSMTEAIARGDATAAVISAAGVAAEGAGLGAEVGFDALGKAFQRGGSTRLASFANSSIGKALGGAARIGPKAGAAGGAVGGIITLPFDIYGAVKSFQDAATSEGKSAQDHYVDGGLAVVGTGTTIALSSAAMAGFSAAGPAGMAAAGALIAASRIYHSARYVEDLGDHTPLSGGEKFVTGLSSFFGGGASQAVEDRVAVSKAKKRYDAAKRKEATDFLKQHPDYGHLIYGNAVIKPQAPSTVGFGGMGGPPVRMTTQYPAVVTDNAGDDVMDASGGVDRLENAVKADGGQGGDVLWMTGAGDDTLVGASDRRNHFVFNEGRKHVSGGQRNDVFNPTSALMVDSVLDGGEGVDTLKMELQDADEGVSIRAVLPTVIHPAIGGGGTPGDLQFNGISRGQLQSIENVITPKKSSNVVIGNRSDNIIVLNGRSDSAKGGGGNDTFVVNGDGVVDITAGYGPNRYVIADSATDVTIKAPGGYASHEVRLDFDSKDFTIRAVRNSDRLEVAFHDTKALKKIVISNVFRRNATGEFEPRRSDEGSISVVTRDGLVLAPTLSSIKESDDGLLHVGVMSAVS